MIQISNSPDLFSERALQLCGYDRFILMTAYRRAKKLPIKPEMNTLSDLELILSILESEQDKPAE